jgi:hypothetical protein
MRDYRVIVRIGTTNDADGCLLLAEMQTSNIRGLRSAQDPNSDMEGPPGKAVIVTGRHGPVL